MDFPALTTTLHFLPEVLPPLKSKMSCKAFDIDIQNPHLLDITVAFYLYFYTFHRPVCSGI